MVDLPLAYAFSAGMVASVNPCGFAMLPAYVSYLLGTHDPAFEASPLEARAARALALGTAATLGFVTLFAAVGSVVALGGRAIVALVPWAALLIGVALVALGLALLAGRSLRVSALGRLTFAPRPGWRGVFLFGVGYGIASLACTLPIFLVVVGGALARSGVMAALGMFVAYALGMGVVLAAVAVEAALFKGAVATALQRAMPFSERLSAVLLIGAGLYLAGTWAAPLIQGPAP